MENTLLGTHLPYCLLRQPDGRYAVVNRRYKPVGMTTPKAEWIDYAAHPCLLELRGLTEAAARDISWNADTSLDRIYLYNDGTDPLSSAAHWDAYAQRLHRLGKLKTD